LGDLLEVKTNSVLQMTDSLNRLYDEANTTLLQAVAEDRNDKKDIAYKLYEKAYKQLCHYRKEFDDRCLRHFQRAEELERTRSSGSSTTATVQFWRFPTDSSPKSSYFVKSSNVKSSNVKFDDVAGLEHCKQVLIEAATWPEKFPKFFTGNRKPWRSVLLFGPPGSGKTLLAKAIAAKAGFHFSSISPSAIVSKWMGESEQHVKDLFQEAREKRPSIIFIDEIDSLCGTRGANNENEPSRRIKSELLVHMQGVCDGVEHVLILAATNTPYALDKAILRRFDLRIYIPLPNEEARKHIFKVQIGETPSEIDENGLKRLAEWTDGFSGSDISSYVKDALYRPIRTLRKKSFVKTKDNVWVPCHDAGVSDKKSLVDIEKLNETEQIQVPKITLDDFEEVRYRHKRTVKDAELKQLEEFKNEFGVAGEM
ncbi:hypothetical protein CMV_023862, partial [Castanea mollissima]